MRTLLLDGDMFAYRVAAAEEKPLDFGEQFILSADAEMGALNLTSMIEGIQERLGADRIIIALTDDQNFRKKVLPTYKSNRANVRRPIILGAMKRHLEENFECFTRPTLEADDVLGILQTNDKIVKGEKIIVTWDKDLRTVPGLHWNPSKDDEPVFVTEAQADRQFYIQTLSGDIVDGYQGCPGVGTITAAKIVDDPYVQTATTEEIKRGPNKGKKRTRWLSVPSTNIWEVIVSHFVKAGQTEEDALRAARVARILRTEDYDYKKKEPILWQPNS